MIQFVDEAIESLFRLAVPLPEAVADISFAAPARAWGAAITRPTVNVFLWDVRRNQGLSSTGLGQQWTDGQHAVRRPTDPVVDLRYLVTAWATEERDEHQLLGSVLRCVLSNSTFPDTVVPPALAGAPFVRLALANEEARVPGEFWSSLDGQLKPGLQVVVTLPVAVFEWLPAGPQAQSVSVATKPLPPHGGAGAPDGANRETNDLPLLRRRRSNGALTMEGRPLAPGTELQPGGD